MILLREILSEKSEDSVYTDEEKQQLGIPLNAVSSGGKWYVDDIYAGKVVDGKFKPVQYEKPTEPDTDGDAVELTPLEDSELEDYPTLRDARKLPRVSLGGESAYAGLNTISDRMGEMGYDDRIVDVNSPEAVRDAELIEFDEAVYYTVDRWQRRSVWLNPPRERQEMFDTMDDFINQNNTTVTENLYRGLHFGTKLQHNKTFIKTILNKMAVGNEIPLPPSGFSARRTYALQYAGIGLPVISVVFMIPGKSKPVKGVRVWLTTEGFDDEREVITSSGNYKILSVVMQEFDNYSDYRDPGRKVNVICLMIELEQAESVNETKINEADSKLFAILFGDSMRNTAKNLKELNRK
jgi:hypothetical protein